MSTTIKTSLQDQVGFRWRGGFGILFLLPAGALAIFSQPMIREGTWLDLGLELSAWMLFLLGLILRIWATLYVGARKTQTLVVEGPFSICRNPLYLGSLLVACSAGLFLESLTFQAAVSLVTLCYMRATVPLEEQALREIHGGIYEDYCRRVPRYWPRFSLFQTPDSIVVKIQGLRIEMKRLAVWIWIPALGTLLAHSRGQSWWPHWVLMP